MPPRNRTEEQSTPNRDTNPSIPLNELLLKKREKLQSPERTLIIGSSEKDCDVVIKGLEGIQPQHLVMEYRSDGHWHIDVKKTAEIVHYGDEPLGEVDGHKGNFFQVPKNARVIGLLGLNKYNIRIVPVAE